MLEEHLGNIWDVWELRVTACIGGWGSENKVKLFPQESRRVVGVTSDSGRKHLRRAWFREVRTETICARMTYTSLQTTYVNMI